MNLALVFVVEAIHHIQRANQTPSQSSPTLTFNMFLFGLLSLLRCFSTLLVNNYFLDVAFDWRKLYAFNNWLKIGLTICRLCIIYLNLNLQRDWNSFILRYWYSNTLPLNYGKSERSWVPIYPVEAWDFRSKQFPTVVNLVPRVLVTLVQRWSGQQGPLGYKANEVGYPQFMYHQFKSTLSLENLNYRFCRIQLIVWTKAIIKVYNVKGNGLEEAYYA